MTQLYKSLVIFRSIPRKRLNLQKPKPKDTNQNDFLMSGDMKLSDHWNRKTEDDNIEDEIQDGMREEKCAEIQP